VSVQTIYFHYTPSLLHILKMMMNVVVTLQLMAEYSTFFLFLLFSTPLLLLLVSTILLPPPDFIYAHSFEFPFPLLFIVVFSIALFAFILLQIPKLWKCAQLPAINANYFQGLLHFFLSLNILPVTFIFSSTHHLLINAWSSKLIQPITRSLCPLYNHVEALNIIIMNECRRFHLLITPHP